MGANLIIYCLEQVTDYMEFERLCHDIMSLAGYKLIEPLGGFKDKGRDAIHFSTNDGVTIFAYSVREDWRAKLAEDSNKIHSHKHACNSLVFITTAAMTAGERDEAIGYIKDTYGWHLEIYNLERLRNLLEIQYPDIKFKYPQIFPPDFLAITEQTSSQREHIFISYSKENLALAEWLTRKLISDGYMVWCERFGSLGGDSFPSDTDDAIQNRVFCFVALYSLASLNDPDIVHQRLVALGARKSIPNIYIALRVEEIPVEKLDQATRQLVFLPFETSWAEGLNLLLKKLESLKCPKPLVNGKFIAAGAFLEKDVLSSIPEMVVSNYLKVQKIPENILRFSTKQEISEQALNDLKLIWSFRSISKKLLVSFQIPPAQAMQVHGLTLIGKGHWRGVQKVEGVDSKNLVSELIRKGLTVKYIEKGLRYCPSTHSIYFPYDFEEGKKIKYHWPNGKSHYIQTIGERKYYPGGDYYRYYLAPDFFVSQSLEEEFSVLVNVRVRITDTNGTIYPTRKAISRRKDLCSEWWNGEWLSRMLAICEFSATDEKIVIGETETEQIIINANPECLIISKGVDEDSLGRDSYERDDLFLLDNETNEENEAVE